MFYYGAQYFRPPNPLPQFWEEDFKKMKDSGFNVVKLWAMWADINYKEGVYDFDALNRLSEIADRNGIKVIFNTIIENTPYWLTVKYPEAMHKTSLGYTARPQSRGNTPAGGWPGLCLHNEPVKEAAAGFFKEIAKNFKGMSNLYAYDIWNETFFEPLGFFARDINTGLYCYCDATQNKFKEWLKKKYKSLAAINEAWYRRYSDWDQVYAPIQRGGYPDMLDWLTFRLEDFAQQMQWRYDTLRNIDTDVKLISHFCTFDQISALSDLPNMAKVVDEWGVSSFNGIYNRAGDVEEHMLYRLDAARVDAKGKKFWQAELKGGQNTGGNAHFPIRRSPMARENTMRAWNWCVLMSGAKGIMYWQYRPEQLGPETPGNGLTDLAGRDTERLKQAAWFARFTNQHEFIEHTVPVKAEIGILKLYEANRFSYLLDGKTNWYDEAIEGAYTAFSALNYVVDVIYIDAVYDYEMIYIPFAQMIEKENIAKIKEYVKKGGKVVSEACTAHYTDGGYCSFHVPGEMTDMFGAEEYMAESLFDVDEKPDIRLDNGIRLKAAVYQEWFTPLDGNATGKYEDGSAAVVENSYGSGKAMIIGTYPSLVSGERERKENSDFFRYLASWAGMENNVSTGDGSVKARLHTYNGKYYLYIVNLKNRETEVEFTVNSKFGCFTKGISTVKGESINILDNRFKLQLKNCEGDIMQLT